MVLVVSGGIACGKSELVRGLANRAGCTVFRTADLIRSLRPRTGEGRIALQRAGNRLDRETNYSWIATDVARLLRVEDSATELAVIDGVRKPAQMREIQTAFGHRKVRHVHLTASLATRRSRFVGAPRAKDAGLTFDRAIKSSAEKEVKKLAVMADAVIDTDVCTPEDILARVSARVDLGSRPSERLVDVVVGGQYGSEGKGNIADYLSSEYDVLVRVGGPNAGHVVYEEPPYTHISLPCGTRRNDTTQLIIGPGAVIDPTILLEEIRACQVEPDRLIVDERVAVIEASDAEWETKNLRPQMGSTGVGAGMATARRITGRFRDERRATLAADLGADWRELQPYIGSARRRLARAYERRERILVEGTQGTGLSIFHGEYPCVTSRDTTVSGCLSEAGIGPNRVRRIVMVCRTYPIRVAGESGPMSTELAWETVSGRSGLSVDDLKNHERSSRTRQLRRVGEFDWAMLKEACHLNTPTDIALTFVDYLSAKNRHAIRFDQLTPETIQFIEEVEMVSGVPCSLVANRFDYKCVIDRRRW